MDPLAEPFLLSRIISFVSCFLNVRVFCSGEKFGGDYEFEMGFESQKKVAKSGPWTVSVSIFVSTTYIL